MGIRKTIPVEEAVGHVLAHDITEIRPGEFKGAAFKKGHIVTRDDIPHLKRLGKEELFVLSLDQDEVHEDDAARRLAKAFSGENVLFNEEPSEGKISLRSDVRGLLKVQVEALTEVCMIPEICLSSLHTNTSVIPRQIIASTRVIPLVVKKGVLDLIEEIVSRYGKIFEVRPFKRSKTGIVITGNEVYYGLIEDKFQGVLKGKLASYDCQVTEVIYCPDDKESIKAAIHKLIDMHSELVLVSGGMSVDPNDVSKVAISEAGARDLVYGTPILPGAMFLYCRIKNTPVMGLPACVLYFKTTVFDIMLPRVLAGDIITRKDLARLAHGGLCLNCSECRYPICPFGKG